MSSIRVITLPNGRTVTLRTYVSSWRSLLACQPDEQVGGFFHHPSPAISILGEIRRGVHARINRGTSADRETPAEHALHAFHRRFTGSRAFLRRRDIACLRLSQRMRRRIETAFAARIHDNDE